MLTEQLRSRDVVGGLRNCHAPGLHSLVLRERPDGSLSRIFYTTPDHELDRLFSDSGHFTLGAHNHDKPLHFRVLYGTVLNVVVEPTLEGIPLWCYEFRSALAGDQFYLGEPDPLRARVSLVNLHGLDLSTDDIHTVLVSSRRAAWLVDEGPVQPVIKEIFSPRADLSLTRDGLYLPMDVAEACDEILMGLQQ